MQKDLPLLLLMRHLIKLLMEHWAKPRMAEPPSGTDAAWASLPNAESMI
jgi:hypothetical protein